VIPATTVPNRSGASGPNPVTRGVRRPLPIPTLAEPPRPATEVLVALSAADHSGRIADRTIITALGWAPGTRLHIREQAGPVVVTRDGGGVHRVSDRGYLHLPLAVRRWWRLGAGDRVLLTADRGSGVLVVHPPTVVGTLASGAHAAAVERGAAA
jgi:hypothetical protein